MINAHEAIIELFRADSTLSTLTNDYIASLWNFGQDTGDWNLQAKSLTIARSGGTPNLDLAIDRGNYLMTCYGQTPDDAQAVVNAVVPVCRAHGKREVSVSGGETALVYFVVIRSQSDVDFNEELQTYFYQLTLEAEVAETAIV